MKKWIYGLGAFIFVSLLAITGIISSRNKEDNFTYVSKGMFDYESQVEVVATESIINKPFVMEDVKTVISYYDYNAEPEVQKNSLLFYENTYMPSTGVAYSNGNPFDIVSVLSGTVTEVKKDETLGNSITVQHDNGIVSVYQSIADIEVKEGDSIIQGQKLGTSSVSNISSNIGNHLYFELIVNGECVNPENYFGKKISEI